MRGEQDIIERLVQDLRPVRPHALRQAFLLGVAPAMAVSLLLLVILGIRPDMAQAVTLPVFWIKSAYNALIALATFPVVYHLARPDGIEGPIFKRLAIIVGGMALLAAGQLLLSEPDRYPVLIVGSSALHCPFVIGAFALPVLAGTIWALRQGAPTDLRMTGFIAGLAAGATGAWVYSWFCTENGMPFVLIWYSLGITLTGAIGALAGPRLLRW